MGKGKTSNVNFFNLWLNYKIEKLREIEHQCSVIMRVLNIAEKPSNDVAWCDTEGLTDNCDIPYRKPPELKWDDNSHSWKVWDDKSQSWKGIEWKKGRKQIDWGKVFDKLKRGEKTVYRGFRHWHSINRWGTPLQFIFPQEDHDKKDDFSKPWIKAYYGDSLDSFQTIRDDCNLLSKLLKAGDYDERDFKDIEDTVNGVIQGAFTLIGTHDKKHGIEAKLREYEAQAQKRKKAYEEGPGTASAIAGGWSIKAAEKILKTCGGIAGYDALPHGSKQPIRDEIENAIKDPDGRNVYNILKKIRNKPEQN